jgi:hypothetical protein
MLGLGIGITGVEIQDPAVCIDIELRHYVKLYAEVGCKTLMLLDMKHTSDLLVHGIADGLAKEERAVMDIDEGDADALSVLPRQNQKVLCPEVGDSDVVGVNP